MKKYNTLNKKWKEILYAFSGFGPNLLMVLMGAFFTDAINPAALESGSLLASSHVVGGISLILPAIFPALWAAAKAFDGIVDVPLGALTDNLNTKWGKRRIPIIVSFPIMVLAYFCCWMPLATNSQLLNTIWITSWALVFFSTYTMSLIAFYGSLSTVCVNESQRTRVSSFKAFFDTISYCLVYALVPLIIDGAGIHIDQFVLLLLPIMGSILIPVFMIKEGEKFEKEAIAAGYDITPLAEEPKYSFWQSIKTAFKNKPFMSWVIVNCCAFFGLNMFLVSMNVLIYTGMGFDGAGMAVLNTCAFAPVPVMLFIFNKIKVKKGIRFAYQLALISFAVSILAFVFSSKFVLGDNNVLLQYIIGCIGGMFGSFGIGAFFMVPYLIPTQIAVVEEKLIGKNITAMFVAVQAFTSSIVGAISGGLIYERLKMYFFTVENQFRIVWAKNFDEAAQLLSVNINSVFNLAVFMVPFLVSIFCIVGFIVAFRMPKNYSFKEIVNKMDLTEEKRLELLEKAEEDDLEETRDMIINIPLWVLSGSIFGIFWRYDLVVEHTTFKTKKCAIINWAISVLLFPYSAYLMYKCEKENVQRLKEKDIKVCDLSILVFILSLIGLNIGSYIIIESQMRKGK